jgi:hypothetical protein
MKKNTPESYLIEIKLKYAQEKAGDYACYLAKPTPASLNNLCKLLDNEKISKTDKEILNRFYGIEKFDIDKFRPICNFFKEKTEIPNPSIVDVMAFLVDFEPRPLGKYLKIESTVEETQSNKEKELINPIQETTYMSSYIVDNQKKEPWIQKNKLKIGTAIFILFSGFITKQVFFPAKDCMIWKENHYEATVCEEVNNDYTNGIGSINLNIIRNDILIENFRKIEVNSKTVFFKNGKPCIWYGKSFNGIIEYFTYHGQHPETGKTLKEITPYMIEKYVYKN